MEKRRYEVMTLRLDAPWEAGSMHEMRNGEDFMIDTKKR